MLAALFLAGCGGDGDAEEDVQSAVERYFVALSERDFATACELVTPSFRDALVAYAERAYPELGSDECVAIARRAARAGGERLVAAQNQVRVREVEVDGSAATARLGPGQVATLERIEGDWLIETLDFSGAR
ncbi:MAG: hypothetical protein ACR2GT_02740 [Gaiellaceae bacterium]